MEAVADDVPPRWEKTHQQQPLGLDMFMQGTSRVK